MNAVILAAGTSSRFVPLSFERPKALLEVKGEILIERQIRQLREAGVNDIVIVVGYKKEMFDYLIDKFGVQLVFNPDYARYNNISSLMCVLEYLGDTYICSSDNYFVDNVFLREPQESEYAAMYAHGETNEYCLDVDQEDNIVNVSVGGKDAWYMVGHVFFHSTFSTKFKPIMESAYKDEGNRKKYWEDIYIAHIADLPKMKVNRFGDEVIKEFDSLEELRSFDSMYEQSGSQILSYISEKLNCKETDICNISQVNKGLLHAFTFMLYTKGESETYLYYENEGSRHIESINK